MSNFILLWEFECDFESIEKWESLTTKTLWNMHRITGTKNMETKDEERTSITSSMTLCVNEDYPSLSFSTHSKRFIMNGNAFTLDLTKNIICVLAHWKIIEIPYTSIWKIIKEGDGNEYFTFNKDGIDRKLTFSDGKPEIISLS